VQYVLDVPYPVSLQIYTGTLQSLPKQDPTLTLGRLHLSLIVFHGIIILTRPFFLHQTSIQAAEVEEDSMAQENGRMAHGSRTEKERLEQAF
jgi:hypothetical protein